MHILEKIKSIFISKEPQVQEHVINYTQFEPVFHIPKSGILNITFEDGSTWQITSGYGLKLYTEQSIKKVGKRISP